MTLPFTPVPKPEPQPKDPKKRTIWRGKSPGESGRKYERRFANKYDEPDGPKATRHACPDCVCDPHAKPLIHFRRNPGSGAFMELKGDVIGDLARLNVMFETKSWNKVDGRGEKTVTFPASLLYKLDEEAKTENRVPMFIYHIKGDSEEWAVIRYSWLHERLREYELQLRSLNQQLEEALANAA